MAFASLLTAEDNFSEKGVENLPLDHEVIVRPLMMVSQH
jgi:hypothetical protein